MMRTEHHDQQVADAIHGRKGDWMQTRSGGKFWPLDPREEEVSILDIAAALSKLCRYGGHCLRFYSVAEHSVLCMDHAPAGLRLATLLHDAAEAYLVDVPRPIKRHLGNYGGIEAGIMRVIAAKYGFDPAMHARVKEIDDRILADERAQNMVETADVWAGVGPALGVTLRFWTPQVAEQQFLDAFEWAGDR